MTTRPAIGDYGLVGDTRTAALVSAGGSVDWMCVPRFDGAPLFGGLVDAERGGSFTLELDGVVNSRRRYLDGSAVLRTDVETTTGSARRVDAMIAEVRGTLLPQNLLIRRVECLYGDVALRVCFDPRLGLPGRAPDRVRRIDDDVVCEWGALAVSIGCSLGLRIEPGRPVEVRLGAGESATFTISVADRCPLASVSPGTAADLVAETDRWWREWSSRVEYEGPYREAVVRSLITLRLLTYSPSGAPVAAPTTSLPEAVGAGRNWDYRYAWPRDASIGLVAFLSTGNSGLAHSFMHWLLHASRLTRPRLRVLYDVHGRPAPAEREIAVSGYQDSTPVRIGNDATAQHQLDVYGWVVDAAWLLDRSGHRLHGETWRAVAGFADYVASVWREPDAGIWEVRGDPAHYVHSKLMAWLALDRAARLARGRRVRRARVERWARERDAVASWVRENGVDRERNTLVWKAGSKETDAALLLLPVLRFEPPGSALVSGTIDAIRHDLETGDGLTLRYPRLSDALEGEEGAFFPCSFWLVQALAHAGRRDEAAEMFESLLSHANDVGLFGEEVDPETKETLGNFPQAFTHATVVQAALSLTATVSSESRAF
nr:hypothetical protein [uncultured bacterium]